MDTTKEAMKIATGMLELVMSEKPAGGEKCKVDVEGAGDPEPVEDAVGGRATFAMGRWVDGPNGQPKGRWNFTVTVQATYEPFEEELHHMFKSTPNASVYDTSFYDVVIFASLERLVAMFGNPNVADGYKITHEWVLKDVDTGDVVTVYDYKYNGAARKEWHVGAKSRRACLKFERWFNKQHV